MGRPVTGFNPPGGGNGPGRFGGNIIRGVELPAITASSTDPDKPLLSKLLAVPALRTKYLGYVRSIATEWLDWKKVGPIAERYQALIADDVKSDTRKLDSFEGFQRGLTENSVDSNGRGPRPSIGIRDFVEQRRAYLLKYSASAAQN